MRENEAGPIRIGLAIPNPIARHRIEHLIRTDKKNLAECVAHVDLPAITPAFLAEKRIGALYTTFAHNGSCDHWRGIVSLAHVSLLAPIRTRADIRIAGQALRIGVLGIINCYKDGLPSAGEFYGTLDDICTGRRSNEEDLIIRHKFIGLHPPERRRADHN